MKQRRELTFCCVFVFFPFLSFGFQTVITSESIRPYRLEVQRTNLMPLPPAVRALAEPEIGHTFSTNRSQEHCNNFLPNA